MVTPALYTGNQLELLAHKLAQNIRAPLASPFAQEMVIVQSQSMARWLRLELAREHGISANYLFPFPKAFALGLFSSVATDRESLATPFEPASLVWAVFQSLPGLADRTEFESIKRYINDSDSRKLFQLSEKIARLFDQYIVFRPDLILEWDGGKGEGWQPILWRQLIATLGNAHPALLRKRFLEFVSRPNLAFAKAPERISVFGISALPKFYLELFEALAPHSQISFYLMQPCAEWWGHISSDRETGNILRRMRKKPGEESQLHLERGNRLLASLGQQGREFLNLLHEFEWSEHDLSQAPSEDSLLHHIQADIFTLRDRGVDTPKQPVAPEGDSITIHNCHSPLREMEILHDHILDWFQRDPTLTPRDILVVTPKIDIYAPFIRAVFESPEDETHRIPLSIADCSPRSRSAIIEAFLKILGLPQTRLEATTILSILETPAIYGRWSLNESYLELIRLWVDKSGIRWGKDSAQKAEFDLPEIASHTWRQGLDRLLLGYGLTGTDEELYEGILPFADVEGDRGIALGKFAEFVEKLFRINEELKSPRTLSGWVEIFRDILETFFNPGDQNEGDLQFIHSVLAEMVRNEALSRFEGRVPLDVVLESLVPKLNEDVSGAGYLTGGVMFCALKPARSIPFKIICLVGMNDSVFPRADSWLSFDLTAQEPRLGDRSSREDDRYLFLETLLSAREKLYLSYTGQSIRDNSPSPPSVLVNQLLDYIDQGFASKDGGSLTEHLVLKHRLQAFSPDYFMDGRLFTYSRQNFSAGQSAQGERVEAGSYLPSPLPEPEVEFRQVSIESLVEFLCHPARFLASRRMGIQLPRLEAAMEDAEPFSLDALDQYQLKQRLLEMRVAGKDVREAAKFFEASGVAPAGAPGRIAFQNIGASVEGFYTTLAPYLAKPASEPRAVEHALGGFHIVGQFKNATNAGLISYRFARITPKDVLRAWVQHVVWNATTQAKPISTLIGVDEVWKFQPLENPNAVLESLLGIYWRGLKEPLKFFPRSAFAFIKDQGRKRREPMKVARDEWRGNGHTDRPGESEDSYFNLFFRNIDPIDAEFSALANEIYGPALQHAEVTAV